MIIKKTNERHYLFLILLFFIISLIGINFHEIWLDESHHWLLARDSYSLSNLILNTNSEGHPILWNILLFYITRFTLNPYWMQLFHILISTSAVLIFLKKAPFSLLFKTLFIFGYFILYEYNIISRNYMLGVLFLFLACSIFKDRGKNFILLCFLLAVAANTHLMFSVISIAIFLTLIFEIIQDKALYNTKTIIYGVLLFLFGIIISIIQIIPETTSFFDRINDLSLQEKLIPGGFSFFKGLFPIPDFRSIQFWNSNLFVNISKPISAITGIIVYFIPLFLFYKRKYTLFFVYIALLGTQVFFFITQISATRYFGMTFIILIIAMWLNYYYSTIENTFSKQYKNLRNTIIYGILIIQCVAGVIAFTMDIIYPFSSGKEVALFLKEKELLHHTIVTQSCEGTVISSDIRKKLFFLCGENLESFCRWGITPNCKLLKKDIIQKLSKISSNESIIFISKEKLSGSLDKNIWHEVGKNLNVKLLTKIDTTIVRRTDYYIYEVKNKFND